MVHNTAIIKCGHWQKVTDCATDTGSATKVAKPRQLGPCYTSGFKMMNRTNALASCGPKPCNP